MKKTTTAKKSPAKKLVAKKTETVGNKKVKVKTSTKKYKKGGMVKKYQEGDTKLTPFQEYMKNPGAVASDTVMVSIGGVEKDPRSFARPNSAKAPSSKDPKNQGMLEKAFKATYGLDWKDEIGFPADGETYEQYRRRMGPLKKGGTFKKTTKTASSYKKGGTHKAKPKAKKK